MANCMHLDSETFYSCDSRQITGSKFSVSLHFERKKPNSYHTGYHTEYLVSKQSS